MTRDLKTEMTNTSRKRSSLHRSRIMISYLYVLPAALFVVAFLIYPMVTTLVLSFTKSDGLTPPQFTGLANYARLFVDPNFLRPLGNTVIWTIASLIFPVTLGFIFAFAINSLPRANFFQMGIYLPATISAAAAGILFTFFLDKNGIINIILRAVGLDALALNWLFVTPQNTFSMIFTYPWQATGLNMMLFLVGLQTLPKEPIEAARIDGAIGWSLTRHIILPMLMPYIVITSLLAVVNGFKVFDTIWVMTQGGPARTSESLAVTMYREGFILFNQGYAAAVAVVISIVALGFSYFYLRTVLGRESHL